MHTRLLLATVVALACLPATFAADPRAGKNHWAFQPVRRPEPPAVADETWCRNPIDRFILARLEQEGVEPSPEADRATLIRRVYLDLIGLPPTPAEVDAFLADESPDAYERLVDRLLASPHYGERWARHWLDAARYGDSHGFTIDGPRSIWKYRDWVIDAFNRDLPFDRFTVEQLAGDLLPEAATDQLVATGFHRNTQINQEGGIDPEQFRVEAVVDRVNTTGTVWLGLTVGCAQCHDHKYDPISQKEYYRLFAFFNNQDEPNLEILSPEQQKVRAEIRKQLAANAKLLEQLDPTGPERLQKWELSLNDTTREALPPHIQKLLEIAPNGRSARQIAELEKFYRANDQARHAVGGLGQTLPFAALLHAHLLDTRLSLVREQAELKKREPRAVTTMILRERKAPRMTHVQIGGDFLRLGEKVEPGTPAVLHPFPESEQPTRLDLARWLTDPANPLTARVTVNRYWQRFFGLGLVETENDFGTQGTPPSHPGLLDWLAGAFVESGWKVKAMHRLIVTSATYRQGSHDRPDLATLDPRNRLLARQNRLRLEAEVIRDVSLAAGGLLTRRVGGPGVFPPQPEGVYNFTQINKNWKADAGPDRFRRGMYTYFWRSAPHPALVVFDAPDGTNCCTRRNRSNTPLQALTLLNDAGFLEHAHGLARRVLGEGSADDAARLTLAFRLCLGREPGDGELSRLSSFLEAQRADLAARPDEARDILATGGPVKVTGGTDDAERAAWVMVARVLLNLDEFITRE